MADFQLATTAPLLLFGGGGIGQKGDRGSEQLFGTRDPLPEDGNLLDTWKNKRTGDVFKKIDAITWEFVGTGEALSESYGFRLVDQLGNKIIDQLGNEFSGKKEITNKNIVTQQALYLTDQTGARIVYA
jgi:hypothetical protein